MDHYISGGFVKQKIRYNTKERKLKSKKWEPKKMQLKAFKRTLNKLKENNTEVFLIYAPVTKQYFASYENNQSFDSIMNTYGAYYNFNTLMQLDDSLHFYDYHHLNYYGVEKFNEKLISTLGDKLKP